MDEEGSARYHLHLQKIGTFTSHRQVNCEAKVVRMLSHNKCIVRRSQDMNET